MSTPSLPKPRFEHKKGVMVSPVGQARAESSVVRLTGHAIPAKEQGRFRRQIPVRQDRLGLVMPVSTAFASTPSPHVPEPVMSTHETREQRGDDRRGVPLGVSVDDLPCLALLVLVGKLDVVGDDIDRRGFLGRDQVGQYRTDDRGHTAEHEAG